VRTDQTPWHFLLNPAAGRGKALRRWQKIRPVLQAALPAMTIAESSAQEGMAALAEAAVRSGKTHLVGVGGDGTHHDIVNGIVRADGLASVIYTPLPLGTGNDWVRTLKTPTRITPWLEMLRQQKTINHRIGQLRYMASSTATLIPPITSATPPTASFRVANTPSVTPGAAPSRSDKRSPGGVSPGEVSPETLVPEEISPEAASTPSAPQGTSITPHRPPSTLHLPPSTTRLPPSTTYFLNVAGLAYDAEVVRRSEKARWKNRWLYPVFTLLYLKDFTPPTVKIEYENNTVTSAVHTINIGIGRYNGGGMRLVPQADPTADTLALTYARKLPIWKILLSSWRFYTGSIGAIAEVTTTHVQSVTISPVEGETALEADGELLGRAPLTASLLEECLRVVVGSAFKSTL
jgi:diacylglycerol kinase family enzyme